VGDVLRFSGPILTNVSAAGTSKEVVVNGGSNGKIMIVGAAGVTAGAVTIEEAPVSGYAGTWAAIGTALTVIANGVVSVALTGPWKVVRARISTAVVGGTITVYAYFT
jgi:hypothetical protein